MKSKGVRAIALAASVFVLSNSVSCGYILHPENRGGKGGEIDVLALVCDILWFIPGILPGVVAIAVDVTTGSLYKGGGSASNVKVLPKGSRLVINKPKVWEPTKLEIRVVTPDGKVVGSVATTVRPGQKGKDELSLDLERVRRALKLRQQTTGGVKAEIHLLVNGELKEKTPCLIM